MLDITACRLLSDMPLYDNIEDDILKHFLQLAEGVRVRPMLVGRLTDEQHAAITAARQRARLPGLEIPEILLLGRHIHQRRVVDDLYTIEDVVLQIKSSLAATSTVHFSSKMTVLRSTVRRADGYGSLVRDEGVLELTVRKPRAELYSVIPKDDISPRERNERESEHKRERPLESGLET